MSSPSDSRRTDESLETTAPSAPQDDRLELLAMRPIQLSLWNVPPLTGERRRTFTFLGPLVPPDQWVAKPLDEDFDPNERADPMDALRALADQPSIPTEEDDERTLSNLFVFQGRAGTGKTTMLEAIHGLFGLMDREPIGIFSDPGSRFLQSKAQLDLLVRVRSGEEDRRAILSIWFGSQEPPIGWNWEIECRVRGAKKWLRLGFMSGDRRPVDASNDLGRRLMLETQRHGDLHSSGGAPKDRSIAAHEVERTDVDLPATERLESIPTLLLFGREPHRAATGSFHAPAKYKLLARDPLAYPRAGWMKLFQRPRATGFEIERRLLEVAEIGARKDRTLHEYRSIIGDLWSRYAHTSGRDAFKGMDPGDVHLVSLPLETMLHATSATMLLIDGLDEIVDQERYHSALAILKSLARGFPELSIIVTVRDFEFVKAFGHLIKEKGIVKGGKVLDRRTLP